MSWILIEHNQSDSNYLLWKCNSRLIKKKHPVDSVAASIPFEQLNSQVQYYLSFLDNEIKQKIEKFKQTDSSSGTGIHSIESWFWPLALRSFCFWSKSARNFPYVDGFWWSTLSVVRRPLLRRWLWYFSLHCNRRLHISR